MLVRSLEAVCWLSAGLRRPVVWLALLAWAVLTALLHFLTPITPFAQFDPFSASEELDKSRPEADRFIRRQVVIATSADGSHFLTAGKNDFVFHGWDEHYYHGPLRVWRLRDGMMLSEFATSTDYLDQIVFAPDASWVSMRRSGKTEVYNVPEGRSFTFDDNYSELCCSCSGQWIAYRHKNALERFYPGTESIVTILEYPEDDPKHAHRSIVHGTLYAVSHDDRWLVVEPQKEGDRRRLILLDVEEGAIVAQVHLPPTIGTRKIGHFLSVPEISNIQIARDKRTLAATIGLDFAVIDIATDKVLVHLRHAQFLGWERSQRRVIAYRNRYRWPHKDEGATRLESWDLDTGECRHTWHAPEPAKIPYSSHVFFPTEDRPEFVSYMEPTDQPVLSPDGSRVVWLSYQHEKQGSSDWATSIRSWLDRPPPADYFYEARILSTGNFSEQARWRIAAPFLWVSSQPPAFLRWTPAGDRLFLANEHVELWDAPPTSLTQQMCVALIGTWMLGCVCYMIQRWRQCKQSASSAPQEAK
jgi:hypothetical protein